MAATACTSQTQGYSTHLVRDLACKAVEASLRSPSGRLRAPRTKLEAEEACLAVSPRFGDESRGLRRGTIESEGEGKQRGTDQSADHNAGPSGLSPNVRQPLTGVL
ncbi:hypothetical protein CMUS01_10273 [Colletotrichum musicola]|uniref:Uncharacterized protein n=1 Tax=Colletotrichum musicola TaxID=2175873 RepID=A0A8H6N8K2_9PEZI|nr:hypothetical protein CMUS01_10273 [Colletotrichum musicola]